MKESGESAFAQKQESLMEVTLALIFGDVPTNTVTYKQLQLLYVTAQQNLMREIDSAFTEADRISKKEGKE